MTGTDLLLLLLIAGICGGVGRSLAGGARGGCLASIVLGFVGALIGTYLSRQFDLPDILEVTIGGREFPIVWSVIGAALFVAVLSLIGGRRGR